MARNRGELRSGRSVFQGYLPFSHRREVTGRLLCRSEERAGVVREVVADESRMYFTGELRRHSKLADLI
jgi:hypothetical protein